MSQAYKTRTAARATMLGWPLPLGAAKVRPMKAVAHPLPLITYRGSACARAPEAQSPISVQALVGRYDEATWQLLARLGYGPRRMANERRGLMALEQRIVHLEELRGATVLHIETELLEVGDTRLRCLHRMCDSESQRTLSTMELTFVLTGIDEGSGTALPPDLAQRALALLAQVSARRTTSTSARQPHEVTVLPV